jgi:hypothetical protein
LVLSVRYYMRKPICNPINIWRSSKIIQWFSKTLLRDWTFIHWHRKYPYSEETNNLSISSSYYLWAILNRAYLHRYGRTFQKHFLANKIRFILESSPCFIINSTVSLPQLQMLNLSRHALTDSEDASLWKIWTLLSRTHIPTWTWNVLWNPLFRSFHRLWAWN